MVASIGGNAARAVVTAVDSSTASTSQVTAPAADAPAVTRPTARSVGTRGCGAVALAGEGAAAATSGDRVPSAAGNCSETETVSPAATSTYQVTGYRPAIDATTLP